jgi:predicted transcriptional regulator
MKQTKLSMVNSNQAQTDVTLNNDGSTFVSMREHARRIDVNQNALKSYILRTHPQANTSKGLSEDLQFICTHYFAHKSRTTSPQAEALLVKVGAAGFRVFNYQTLGAKLPDQILDAVNTELKLVTAIVNTAIEQATKDITHNRAENIQSRSKQLKSWASLDWLIVSRKRVWQYKYELTPKGAKFLKKVKSTFFLK